MSSTNFEKKEDFLLAKLGDKIFESCSHGEDSPIISGPWVVIIEPSIAGNIPKMGIKSEEDEGFFIHLFEDKKMILTDDSQTFFDFNKNDVALVISRNAEFKELSVC